MYYLLGDECGCEFAMGCHEYLVKGLESGNKEVWSVKPTVLSDS